MEEVKGSNPFSSTQRDFSDRDFEGFELGGVVAGEGCFRIARQGLRADGSERLRFVFDVGMAVRDRAVLQRLRCFLGWGSLRLNPRQAQHHQDVVIFSVGSSRAHHDATLPFADRYLPIGNKRAQYLEWKSTFLDYERQHPPKWGRGQGVCSVPGCGRPVRGRNLCRAHYYRETGH